MGSGMFLAQPGDSGPEGSEETPARMGPLLPPTAGWGGCSGRGPLQRGCTWKEEPDRPSGRSGSPLRTAVHGLCTSPRRGGMIQTAEQYEFLHHTLALYAAQLPEEPSP